jgi:hypothetical protein
MRAAHEYGCRQRAEKWAMEGIDVLKFLSRPERFVSCLVDL